MFGLMGLPGVDKMEMKAETRKKAMVAIIIAGILLIGVLTVSSYQAYQVTNNQIEAKNLVTEWVGLHPHTWYRKWFLPGQVLM